MYAGSILISHIRTIVDVIMRLLCFLCFEMYYLMRDTTYLIFRTREKFLR